MLGANGQMMGKEKAFGQDDGRMLYIYITCTYIYTCGVCVYLYNILHSYIHTNTYT
jgi:hypothetical protein